MNDLHKGILKKFEFLKGQLIIGKNGIKGDNGKRLPPDEFVSEEHILHDLIRGFYKPAKKPYLLSYQATESEENYGKQIIWVDSNERDFKRIEMSPPNSPKDNRKKSDIAAARYNLENKIPLGILRKIKKGQNIILGLGIITSERNDGVFILEPYSINNQIKRKIQEIEQNINIEDLNTSLLKEVIQRQGQDRFKGLLISQSTKCALCDIHEPFLVASHIKPWSKSTNSERLDVSNGLLLCPNHDRLFDRGYITFNSDGSILTSPQLPNNIKTEMGITDNKKIKLSNKMKEYMLWHKINVFKSNL
jgi:putative restriction endonuclease